MIHNCGIESIMVAKYIIILPLLIIIDVAMEKLEIPALLLTANDTISSWQAYSMRSKCSNGLAWANKKK